MSDLINCCTPCPTTTTVNTPGVPGDDGADGTNGTNGVNAFTYTSANVTIPSLYSPTITIPVLNSTWMAIGQIIVLAGPAHFEVVNPDTPTTVIATWLNYAGDVTAGTVISAGATVSPAGVEGGSVTMLPTISHYSTGLSQAIVSTNYPGGDPVDSGTLKLTLATGGHYLLFASARFDYVGATFAATKKVIVKLRETTIGPADVTGAVVNLQTAVVTTVTNTFAAIALPAVDYTASAGATIEMYASVETNPGAGSLEVIEASILAIPIF